MLVVGLTGGIGSGKSTVADLFAARGVPVIDMDEIARELTRPGRPALAEIAKAFGPDILNSGGELDRAALRRRIFTDPGARRRLEAILHPRIRAEVTRRLHGLEAPYAVVVIPLLVESGQRDLVDRVLVVDAPEDLQIRRTTARDGVGEEEVRAVLAAQAGRRERLAVADDVIVNDDGPEALEHQVEALHRRYLALAGTR